MQKKDKLAYNVTDTQVVALNIERKRRDVLNELKSLGGPFKNDFEVEKYVKNWNKTEWNLKRNLQEIRQ